MIKRKTILVAIILSLIFGLSGYAAKVGSSYKVEDVIKPLITDQSSVYRTTELTGLSKRFYQRDIEGIYYLDNQTILFSASNGLKTYYNPDACYDLYRYNLKTEKLTKIRAGFNISDCTVNVQSPSDFSILRTGTYLKIKNSQVIVSREVTEEAEKHYRYLQDSYFNESANKYILFCGKYYGKEYISTVYLTNSTFSSSQKLPFSGVYRVQWADSTHILLAYKSGSRSLLANYSLKDKTSTITTLPAKTCFIDPILSDQGLIRFTYLDTQGID
jgi:hypothetical protein